MMFNHRLNVFIKVAETGSTTKASKLLFISQPAVSNAIKKLEDELHVKLFHRDKVDGLILTDAGEKILVLAKQMEDLSNRMYQTAYWDTHYIGGRVRIAAHPILTSTLVTKALRRFRDLHPHVTVEIQEGSPSHVRDLVQRHEVDFAISCEPYGQFDHKTLVHDRIVAAFPAHMEMPEILNLHDYPDILILNRDAYETILDKVPQDAVPNFDNTLLVQTADTSLTMVSAGIGPALISEYTLDFLTAQPKKCPICPEINFGIGLFANDLKDLTPASAEFVCIVEELCSTA